MKRLVLLGGGHAHLHCLASFAADPPPDTEITLISPYPRQVYSGMLPGWIAGHYAIKECVIPLAPLADAARVAFRQTRAVSLDLVHNVVHCEDGGKHRFDVLSIDTGTVFDPIALPGSAEHGLLVRPLEDFIAGWTSLAARLNALPSAHLAMIGGGAAGIELLLSMQHANPRWRYTLVSGANTLPGNVGPRLARILKTRGIALRGNTAAARVMRNAVELVGLENPVEDPAENPAGVENRAGLGNSAGETLAADAAVIAIGATGGFPIGAPGLQRDERGFILVNEHLQSVSHASVFAAGDCSTMRNHPHPRSGVYAVRAGPPLTENLRRALARRELVRHIPQRRSLYLISTGDLYAVASWGRWAWEGRWVWRWKDRIDRAFVDQYQFPPH